MDKPTRIETLKVIAIPPKLLRKQDRRAQPRFSMADVARRADELYEQRGRVHGHDLDDWFQAERELHGALYLTAA